MLTTNMPLIPQLYGQTTPNAIIELGEVQVAFTHKGVDYLRKSRAAIYFVPKVRLSFTIPVEKDFRLCSLISDRPGVIHFELPDRQVRFEGYCSSVNLEELIVVPVRTPIDATSAAEDSLLSAVFHLLNFPEFMGPQGYRLLTGNPECRGEKLCGRVILEADGWRITIAGTENTCENIRSLKAEGGYIVTHTGRIERVDGADFSAEQLEDILQCVSHFLSFAAGRWTCASLPVGFDSKGTRVFEKWGLPRVAPGEWSGACSWFDPQHAELLSEVFPGFYALWNDRHWKHRLGQVFYWYFAANDRGTEVGVDAGIILGQTALEYLAWTYCLEDRSILSKRAFKRLCAAQRIRKLADSLGVPMVLPEPMVAIAAQVDQSWDDLADALTWVRNELIHPEKTSVPPRVIYYETWRHTMWLLDLLLLRLCGHNGLYANRLAERWVGQVEQVPWVMPTQCGNLEVGVSEVSDQVSRYSGLRAESEA